MSPSHGPGSAPRRRLSYANVASSAALILGLLGFSGGAYAVSKIDGGDIAPGTITGKSIASQSIPRGKLNRKLAEKIGQAGAPGPAGEVGPAGEQGPIGPQGIPGTDGAPGVDGSDGADGSALAFAHVNADGTLIAAESKNVDGVTPMADIFFPEDVQSGTYCFDLAAGIAPKNLVATLDTSLIPSSTSQFAGDFGTFASSCPAGFRDAVVMYHTSGPGTGPNRSFFVLFN